MKRIVTLTMNPAIDTSFTVPQVIAERKLRCSRPRNEPGGGGINVSRAILKLEGASAAFYLAGGPNGERFRHFLDDEKLDHHPIGIEGNMRENIVAYEESTDRQFRFGMPGPEVGEREWKRVIEEVLGTGPKPDILVASGSLPPGVPDDFYARLAREAKKSGIRIIVDTKGDALRKTVAEGVYLIKPNLNELGEVTGREPRNDDEIVAQARELIGKGRVEVAVISLGSGGALWVTGDRHDRVHAPTVPVRSKIGAGDSMTAGIVLGLARDMSVEDAILYGVAAGSAAVITPGTELCRKDDTERLFRDLTRK